MGNTKTDYFGILIGIIATFLIYCAIEIGNIDVSSLKGIIMKWSFQVSCILGAFVIIIFRKQIYRNKKEFILLLVTLILCFCMIEIGAKVWLCYFADPVSQSGIAFVGECGLEPIYIPHHYLNYYTNPNYKSADGSNIHNSLGYRGCEIEIPKPKGVYRIVTLGGSTTYTVAVKDWRKDFARQLENELRKLYNTTDIEVVNAGVGGYNSWESLINLEFRCLELEPDMVIIYHGTNDVHTRIVDPAYYKSDNSGRRKQWDDPEVPFIFNFVAVRMIVGNPSAGLGIHVNADTTAGLEKDTKFDDRINRTPMQALEENPPIYFERNLRNMIAVAKEHKIGVLLSTWVHTPSNQFDDYGPHYEMGFKENNEVVKKIAKLHNISCYDFESEMPKDKRYWSDGCHVNEEGAKIKGELFAKFIYENRLIGSSLEHTI